MADWSVINGLIAERRARYRAAGHWTGRSLFELAQWRADLSPDLAVSDADGRRSLVGLLAASGMLRDRLVAQGVERASRVLMVPSHGVGDVAVLLAASRMDLVVALSPPGAGVREVVESAARSGCGSVLISDTHALADRLAQEALGIRVLAHGGGGEVRQLNGQAPRGRPADGRLPRVCDSTRYITFTAGTTGEPKGVQHHADTLSYAGRWAVAAAAPRSGPIIGVLSPSHAAGLAFSVFATLESGRSLILRNGRWHPDAVIAAMRQNDVAYGLLTPTHVLDLVARLEGEGSALDGVTIASGGAPVAPSLVERADRVGIALCRIFGLSECVGHSTFRSSEPLATRMSGEGRPYPGTTVTALDATGQSVVGERGEAACEGPSMFLGYVGESDPGSCLDERGRYRTGDIVEVDAAGRVTVVGRLKDTIIRGGQNIDPAEVERALVACEGVRAAAVRPFSDDRLGQRVGAVVVASEGAHVDGVASSLLASGLARHKIPERWVFVDALPVTSIGKHDRSTLDSMLRSAGEASGDTV
ncbi:class I adenylate-forming enzyme family protein [Aeromicrobium sp.]|uniref:class I adenylate-forming enzyme family protein n=1 Tax=Aeromicrobium sp. TaxID=1871063 RepID=UPI0028B17D2C|nr:class I adenylate-forming enzyme family protein [Aeromicrobium sp.]